MTDLYRMILVDDEDEVRGRISSKISEESGFAVMAAAGNGYDALELIEKHNPHVVLTDIKMPFIDGIELAAIIKRDYPTIRVAFITGYDEFDYAREAVELHVSSYLTKPVTQNDISRFLKRLKAELDQEFQEHYNLEMLKKRYEESLPLIIDNYFTSCLISSSAANQDDIENLKRYGVRLDDHAYLLAFVRIERNEELEDVIEYEKRKLSVRSVASSILDKNRYDYYSFLFNGGIVFLIKEKGTLFRKQVDTTLYEMVKMCEKFLQVRIDIGVSSLHRTFSELKEAYQEGEKALGYSHFLNAGRIIYLDQLEEKRPRMPSLGEEEIKHLEHTVRFGSDRELAEQFGKLKEQVNRQREAFTSYRLYIVSLVNIAVTFADSVEADLQELLGDDVLDRMAKLSSMDQAFDWALAILRRLREWNMHNKMSNSQRYLDNAVRYIEMNYTDNGLSLEGVCEKLGISVSYLSLLFKRHKETSFVKYLTRVRMEKAKELLKLTEYRIIEIAELCGFNDVYYFSHSFKRYTGVSPKKYRAEINP